jgi:sugar phosphate isomerase/epimerase
MDRRAFLTSTGAAGLAAGCATAPQDRPPAKKYQNGASPWPISLDTATIHWDGLKEDIRIAAAAGFDAIEPWEGELDKYEKEGGNLKDIGKELRDRGLIVPSVIGLWNAIPATQEAWEKSLVESRRRMRQASEIGAQHIQVVPQPARPWQEFDPRWAADRYRDLLEIGLKDYNINPAMVFVAFLPGAARLGQAAAIALDADHPKAKIIPDVYHMYVGRSSFSALRRLAGEFIAIFQFNDAPADPPLEKLAAMPGAEYDRYRVFPGDGILPLHQCLKDLVAIGYTGAVSLEMYNPEFWKQDHLEMAKTGLRKTVDVIRRAVG